jgi:transposase
MAEAIATSKKSNAGRKPKELPEKNLLEFYQAIRLGNTLDSACAFANLSEGIVKHWLKAGAIEIQRAELEAIKNGRGELTFIRSQRVFAEFVQEVKKAMSVGETRDLQIIAKAAEDHWQAAAWRRERMQPEKYGRRNVNITGDINHNHKADPQLRRQAMEMVEQEGKLIEQNTKRPR